jgi:hypothetical protein
MKVELLYFDDCPSWQQARENLDAALAVQRIDADVAMIRVETDEAAQVAHFAGSPTIRVDGIDLFPVGHDDYSLACRVYHTPDGQQGWPTQAMIESALKGSTRTSTTQPENAGV